MEFCLRSSFFHSLANHVRVVTWLYLLVSGCGEDMACGRDVVAVLIEISSYRLLFALRLTSFLGQRLFSSLCGALSAMASQHWLRKALAKHK